MYLLSKKTFSCKKKIDLIVCILFIFILFLTHTHISKFQLENGGGRSENGSELHTRAAGNSQYDAAPSGLFDSVRDDPAVSNYGPAPSAVNEEVCCHSF